MDRETQTRKLNREDREFELPLRPQTLDEFLGQEELCERLRIFIGAAKKRSETLGHCILSGPPGLGKTTFANIIAREMQSNLVLSSGPSIEKAGDLAGILTNLSDGDVLFIDEIHRLPKSIEEYLYSAMEDFSLDLVIDSGPSARSVQVKLNPFTLIGATTKMGLLSAPLRSRFAMHFRLDFYKREILAKILRRSSRILNFSISQDALLAVASRSRGTPRIANHLLRWVRDCAQMEGVDVDALVVDKALKMLSIDEKGLDEMDKKILNVMIDHYNGGPVGLKTMAMAVGEESMTLEEVYEPFLILEGFLQRTPKGRKVTKRAYLHMNRALPANQQEPIDD